MSTTPTRKPTEAELAILTVLWERGPSTVREVYEQLRADQGRDVGYTTILKLLQIMTTKGLVRRDESLRTHTYRAALSEDQTQRRLVKDLITRAFGGSAQKLVLHALDSARSSPKELAEIQKLLDEMKESKP
jgi:BlaI family transcriptional regulator, penicillinase repressor